MTDYQKNNLHLNARMFGKKAPKNLLLSKTRPNLVIVRGLYGSGKTTYAHSLGISRVVDTCSIFRHCDARQKESADKSMQRMRVALVMGHSCVVVGLFSSAHHYAPYMEVAKRLGVNDIAVVTMVGEFESQYSITDKKMAWLKKDFRT